MRPKLPLFYPIISESSSPFYDFVNYLSFRIVKRFPIGKYGAFSLIANVLWIYYNICNILQPVRQKLQIRNIQP